MKFNLKVKIYDRILWKNYLAIIGVLSSLITVISFFITAKEINCIPQTVLAISPILVMVVIFLVMWYKANHKQRIITKINGTNIEIAEGDIFELLDREPEKRAGELSVIGVNDFYDTLVDDNIIASKTLHGQYIQKIEKTGKLDQLKRVLETDNILNQQENCKLVPERKAGNKVRHALGSVVEFENYILTAFAKFDDKNMAYLSAEEYVRFWMRFWKNIDEIYAGRTLNIPLMGAGITRFADGKPSKQELLEVMLWTLKISGFCNTYSDKKINIVIYKSDIKDIDFYHIQHNLNK